MSDEAVAAATGHDWAWWKATLDGRDAAKLDHAAIVRSLEGDIEKGWWRQMVAVGYERMIGRRAVGQTCTGTYAAAASRTYAGDKDEAFARWQELVADRTEFAGAVAMEEPRLSVSERWRYWRVDLDDGTKVTIHVSDKAGGKSVIGVDHQKLADKAAADSAKAYWKELLTQV